MAAHHDEQHREREIIVVERAQRRLRAARRVGRATRAECGDHFALGGNDDQEHVGRHDRADRGPDVEVGRARAQQLAQSPRERGGEHEQRRGESARPGSQRRAAQGVVHEPTDDQRRHPHRHGRAR